MLENLIGAVRSMEKRKEGNLKCNECDEDVAVNFCFECRLNLCTICAEHHKRSKNYKGHNVPEFQHMTWGDMTKGKIKNCLEHGELTKFFCDTCAVTLCHDCTLSTKHTGHTFRLIAEIVNTKKEELHSVIQGAEMKKQAMKHSIKRADESLERLKVNSTVSIQCVEETFERFKSLLDQKRDHIINTINQKYNSSSTSIEKARQKNEILMRWIDFSTNNVFTNDCSAEVMNSFTGVKEQLLQQSHLKLLESSECKQNSLDTTDNVVPIKGNSLETAKHTVVTPIKSISLETRKDKFYHIDNSNLKPRPRVTSNSPRNKQFNNTTKNHLDNNNDSNNISSDRSNQSLQFGSKERQFTGSCVTGPGKLTNQQHQQQQQEQQQKQQQDQQQELPTDKETQGMEQEEKQENVEMHLVPINKSITGDGSTKSIPLKELTEMSPDDFQLKRKPPPRPALPSGRQMQEKIKPEKPDRPRFFKPPPPPPVQKEDDREADGLPNNTIIVNKPDRPPSFKPPPPPSQKVMDQHVGALLDDPIISIAWFGGNTEMKTDETSINHHMATEELGANDMLPSPKTIALPPPPPPPPQALSILDTNDVIDSRPHFPIPPKATTTTIGAITTNDCHHLDSSEDSDENQPSDQKIRDLLSDNLEQIIINGDEQIDMHKHQGRENEEENNFDVSNSGKYQMENSKGKDIFDENNEHRFISGEVIEENNMEEDISEKDNDQDLPQYSADIILIKPKVVINQEALELILETVAEACSIELDNSNTYSDTLFEITEEVIHH